jgi:hypothetical protein
MVKGAFRKEPHRQLPQSKHKAYDDECQGLKNYQKFSSSDI